MRKILFVLLLVLTFMGCKPTPSPTDPSEHSEIPIRHKTGKIVSVYEMICGFNRDNATPGGCKGETLTLKNFQKYNQDSVVLHAPILDSQGNVYHRYYSTSNCQLFKNNVPLTQYNRHPEITNHSANADLFHMFLVYDKLFVTAIYDIQLSFCVDGEWYPIETDEGPIDSIASIPWVNNDTIYFLKRMSEVTWDKINYDIVKIPVVNGRPQKGIMAHNEFVITEKPDQYKKTTKRLIIQNGNILVLAGEYKAPSSPADWYDQSNWSLYINGVKMCDYQMNGGFGGMGVVGNDIYYCVQDLRNETATIYKNNEEYQKIQDLWKVMRSINCGDDMYMIIFRQDASGTKYKDVWHNGLIENYPYTFVGAIPDYSSYYYYAIPQISYETYTEE